VLASPVQFEGTGVHSGVVAKLRLLPAPAGSGIRFRRTDLPGSPDIPADLDHVAHGDLLRRTTLAAGDATVCTVEHVLASLHAHSVFDALVEIDAPEAPFLDGSALPFAEQLGGAVSADGPGAREPLVVTRPAAFTMGDAEFAAMPSEQLRLTFFFTSDNPLVGSQSATVDITPESFAREIAPARTFCFFHEIEELRRRGLIKGGNLGSSLVIGRKSILNTDLRFPDEPVRHKLLDLLGDLALLARPLRGHFLAWRSGHRSNVAFASHLRKEFGF
jgi:UDP-3-O-acyl N-acetylglucosamine deacetylase